MGLTDVQENQLFEKIAGIPLESWSLVSVSEPSKMNFRSVGDSGQSVSYCEVYVWERFSFRTHIGNAILDLWYVIVSSRNHGHLFKGTDQNHSSWSSAGKSVLWSDRREEISRTTTLLIDGETLVSHWAGRWGRFSDKLMEHFACRTYAERENLQIKGRIEREKSEEAKRTGAEKQRLQDNLRKLGIKE